MTDEILETPIEVTPPAPLPGKILAQARKEKGLSVADVARSLRLSVRQIEAIDADDFDKLPGKTFLRGFIRNYAKLLQIDPEPLLQGRLAAAPQQRFHAQAITVPPGRVEYSPPPRGQRTFSTTPPRPWLKFMLAAFVVLVLAGGAAYELLRGGGIRTVVIKPAGEPITEPVAESPSVPLALPPAQTQAAPPAAVPQQATPAPKAETQAPVQPPPGAEMQASGRVKFSFSGESWVDIRDKNGRSIYKQLGHAGEEQIISGTPPLFLTIGKADNVKVLYNDKSIDLAPHTSGDVARLNLK